MSFLYYAPVNVMLWGVGGGGDSIFMYVILTWPYRVISILGNLTLTFVKEKKGGIWGIPEILTYNVTKTHGGDSDPPPPPPFNHSHHI